MNRSLDPILSFLSSSSSNDTKMNSNLSPVMLDKIQGLSIQMGELYAQLYRDKNVDSEIVDYALEAYKNSRRMLPLTVNADGDTRHVGHSEAFKSTNGDTFPRVAKRSYPDPTSALLSMGL